MMCQTRSNDTVNTSKLNSVKKLRRSCEEVAKKCNKDVLSERRSGFDVLITKKNVKLALKKRVEASAK